MGFLEKIYFLGKTERKKAKDREMPATKKARIEKAGASVGTTLLQMFGQGARAVRPEKPPGEAYHNDYEKWGEKDWKPEDIPEKCRTLPSGAVTTDLKAFLSLQGTVRFFSAHQNWPQAKKRWCWKKFDELAALDEKRLLTWQALILKTSQEYTAHEAKKKEDAAKAEAEAKEAAAKLVEEALTQAQADASQLNSATESVPSLRRIEEEEGDHHQHPFKIVADQVAPDLTNPTDAYLHELSRLVLLEMQKETENENAALQAILAGRTNKRKRTRESQPRKFDRTVYAGNPEYPGLESYEVSRFVDETPGFESLAEAASHQGNLPAFPTPFERSLIPPDVIQGPLNNMLQTHLTAHSWLQPTAYGLVCRCCFGKDCGERLLTFRSAPLPWSYLRKLPEKVQNHITPDKKHKTPKHREHYVEFTESLALLYRSPALVRGDEKKEDVVTRILNTGHLVRLFQILGSSLAVAKPLQESFFICDLLSTLDFSVRTFLQQGHNLSSATIRNQLVDCMYYRLKERIIKRIKSSRFLAVLSDEAEDAQRLSQVSVVFKILGNEGPEEVFWDARILRGAHTGNNIARLVCNMVEPLNCWSNVCATSTDGGSNMSGKYEGVKTFWQKYCCPFAVWVWCLAHILNLCCMEACEAVPEVNVGFAIVRKVFVLFWSRNGQNVASKKEVLDECRQMVAVADNFFAYRTDLDLVKVGDTRWLSHERAAKTITASLKVCLHAVEKLASGGNEEAVSIKRDFSVTACFALFLLAAVCPIVSFLSRCLQRSDLCWVEVTKLKNETIEKLENLRDNPSTCGEYYLCAKIITESRPEAWWGGFEVNQGMFNHFHRVFGKKYLDDLIKTLQKRLESLPVLEGLGIYDPRSKLFKELFRDVDTTKDRPSEVAVKIKERPQFKSLLMKMEGFFSHFCSSKKKFLSPDIEAPPHDNQEFFDEDFRKAVLFELPRALVEINNLKDQPTFTAAALEFLRKSKEGSLMSTYPKTVLLLELALVLPLGTASVERTFSRLRLLQHFLRSKMKNETLRKLMFISLNLNSGPIDNQLMSDLVNDFCVSSVSAQVEEETNNEETQGTDEEEDSDPEEQTISSQLYMDSKRKLRFAHYNLWKEARTTIQGWRETFRKNPSLFLPPRRSKEAQKKAK